MPLQEFTAAGTKVRTKEPYLNLQKNGRVSINSAALEALNNPKTLVLLFDPETYEFGVRAGRANDAHAYRIRREPNASATTGGNVSALALWNYHGVDYMRYLGRYAARRDDKVLVVSLREKEQGGRENKGE